jgi:hypothetical protein
MVWYLNQNQKELTVIYLVTFIVFLEGALCYKTQLNQIHFFLVSLRR